MINVWSVLFPFLTAFVVTTLATPFSIRLIKKWGLIDRPERPNHPGAIHTKPIPRGGGIPLFIGAAISALIFLPITPTTLAIYFAALLALIVGVIDDKFNAESKDVSPYLRLLINILCAAIVVASGVSITFITNPLGGILYFDSLTLPFISLLPITVSQIISMVWIIWVMNMLNWNKGVDGQMPGIVTISAIVIGLLSLRFPTTSGIDATLAFIVAGSALGFLIYNFHPAKIFPGYGATSLYLLLAVVSILSSAKLATAILVMGVPIIDAGFTILRRVLSGKSPFKGDYNHLYHILLKLKLTQRQIALFYWTISAILGAISLSLDSRGKAFVIIMLIALVSGALLFLHFILRIKHEKSS